MIQAPRFAAATFEVADNNRTLTYYAKIAQENHPEYQQYINQVRDTVTQSPLTQQLPEQVKIIYSPDMGEDRFILEVSKEGKRYRTESPAWERGRDGTTISFKDWCTSKLEGAPISGPNSMQFTTPVKTWVETTLTDIATLANKLLS